MKKIGLLASLVFLAAAGCENTNKSKLDSVTYTPPTVTPTSQPGNQPHQAEKPGQPHTGSIEERVAALEARLDRSAEALNFLDMAYQQQKQAEEQKQRDEPAPDAIFAVDVTNNIKLGTFEGPVDAPVTIVDAFDFACPYCRKVNDTLGELVKEYNGKVRVVYKDMVVHPQVATEAHLATCAAAKQGKYKVFKEAFWDKGFDAYAAARDPSKLGKDNIVAIAGTLQMDVEKLKVDMASDECKNQIKTDMQELAKFKVNSTPTLYVNGTVVGGAMPKEAFKELIDQKLRIVDQSGVKGGEYYEKEIIAKGEKKFRSKLDPKP